MQLNPADLKRHYAAMSNEEFALIRREDLTETARQCYDEEAQRRGIPVECSPAQKLNATESSSPAIVAKSIGWLLILVGIVGTIVALMDQLGPETSQLWSTNSISALALIGVGIGLVRRSLKFSMITVGLALAAVFVMGMLRQSAKPIREINNISGKYCRFDASGKPAFTGIVKIRGVVIYRSEEDRRYMLADGKTGDDYINVQVANQKLPIPAIKETLEVTGWVRCLFSTPLAVADASMQELLRFPWTVPPEQANTISATADILYLEFGLDRYKNDIKMFPTTVQGLPALLIRPKGVQAWRGPYIDHIPKDPWGRDYTYKYPSAHGSEPDIMSLGADGAPGGVGANADIVSWPGQ